MRGEYWCTATPQILVKELPPRARRIHTRVTRLTSVVGTTSACAENTQQLGIGDRIQGNYLRVRGEYFFNLGYRHDLVELPPRARRIRLAFQTILTIRGTTSACAENTKTPQKQRKTPGNYLRVRGEYAEAFDTSDKATELPPRARRIRRTPPQAQSLIGTTSACAENTLNELGLL